MRPSLLLNNPRAYFFLAGSMLLAGCASTLPQSQFITCGRPRADVMNEARNAVIASGFSVKQFLPDSGYLRTFARKIQTVDEISNRRPTLIFVEAQHMDGGLSINAYKVVAQMGSVASRDNVYEEDATGFDEHLLEIGNRLFIFHVGPVVDHMEKFCGGNSR